MFAWWGRTVYRFRYVVIGVMVALCLGGGIYGASLGQHVTQSGFYDETSQSVAASELADNVYGRDRLSHIVAVLDAPDGKKANDPQWSKQIKAELDKVVADHPDQILSWQGYLTNPTGDPTSNKALANDGTRTFIVMPLKGNDDDTILKNYKIIQPDLQQVDDGKIQLAGLQPIASELTGTIGDDQKRAEVAAIPLVAVVLFFVFGTVIAASLPAIIGGLTIMGALGIMRLAAEFTPVHFFAQPVVTLIGLGIAIDYGLFIVSRFREEIAEGYDTEAAVRRTMMTSGRTVMFSAVIIVASSVPLLLFPQGFLKSITYAIIASVMLAAIMSNTVLIAALAVLGPRVDSLGVNSLTKFALPDTIKSDPANPKKNPLALAAIPLGILLPPVGIAVGHIARTRIKKTGEQGAGLALIGLFFAYVGTYAWLAYGVYALKDAGIIEGALYWILLGIVIFCATVTAILVLARYVPLIRRITVWWLHFLAEKTQKTKTREEVEKGFWGTLVNKVMKRPGLFALPIVIVMILLVIPLGQLALGGISEKYLPPDNAVRQAQNAFDTSFPGYRTEKLTLVVQGASPEQLAQVKNEAAQITGFTGTWDERPVAPDVKDPKIPIGTDGQPHPCLSKDLPCVLQNGLEVRNDAAKKIDELRNIAAPKGVTIWVGGTPALEQDSIHSLFAKLPLMVVVLILTTTVLMFLAFGSLVLPIKAALMSALTLGSTMGILTWMFVDGHGSGLMNYTPQPLMAPMIGLIIAVIWGLSTDYEVFLVSRMVEARARGMSTAEAIRIGTATTGRLITGAALILAVVAGAFVFSDLVMMKYLAFGLLLALLLDATIIRMFLVPAIMKMLGDDCWWAPQWMKRIQERLGLGEVELPDERKRPTARDAEQDAEALVGAGAPVRALPPHDPTHPQGGQRTPATGKVPPQRVSPPSAAGTTRIPTAAPAPAAEPPTTRMPAAPVDPPTTRTPRVDPGRTAATPPPRTPAPARGSSPRGASANGSREIESWLGDLRGAGAAPQPQPQPQPRVERRQPPPPPAAEPPTTAIPTQRPQDADATEKIDTRDADKNPKRRGGGVSAADLLRREGRL
ncbi:MAG: drug exporters of the superfamily-like protein [Mycobacterium sp.]|nr:drug exporters of the superfamily-like protein [Mycobacterium sp.]